MLDGLDIAWVGVDSKPWAGSGAEGGSRDGQDSWAGTGSWEREDSWAWLVSRSGMDSGRMRLESCHSWARVESGTGPSRLFPLIMT